MSEELLTVFYCCDWWMDVSKISTVIPWWGRLLPQAHAGHSANHRLHRSSSWKCLANPDATCRSGLWWTWHLFISSIFGTKCWSWMNFIHDLIIKVCEFQGQGHLLNGWQHQKTRPVATCTEFSLVGVCSHISLFFRFFRFSFPGTRSFQTPEAEKAICGNLPWILISINTWKPLRGSCVTSTLSMSTPSCTSCEVFAPTRAQHCAVCPKCFWHSPSSIIPAGVLRLWRAGL